MPAYPLSLESPAAASHSCRAAFARGAIVLLLATACGGSDPSKNLSNFTGATWTGTVTDTVTCSGQAPVSASTVVTIQLAGGAGADLQYLSNDGCLFKFNVSGSTASLSNAPVTCTINSGGSAFQVSVSTYTLTTSDGRHLIMNATGTVSSAGTTCPQTLTGSADR